MKSQTEIINNDKRKILKKASIGIVGLAAMSMIPPVLARTTMKENGAKVWEVSESGNTSFVDLNVEQSLEVGGGNIRAIEIKTADYTMLLTDFTIMAQASSNTVTIQLPPNPNQGQIFNIACIDSTFTCTVGRNGNNIDDEGSDIILQLHEEKSFKFDSVFGWKTYRAYNPQIQGGFVYLGNGREDLDGSIRLNIVTFANKKVTEVQKRTDGIWAGTSFKTGPNSVIVGNLISLSAAGSSLITQDTDGDSHFHVRSGVSNGVTTDLSNIVHASEFFEEVVFFADTDGEFTGTSIEKVDTNTVFHLITQKFYFKTGNTAAGDNIRIQAWSGTDDTGTLIFDQTYAASNFPANSDVSLELDGFLEFELGVNTFSRISSDSTFSLKTDAAVVNWYLAVDFSVIQNDDLLQTNEWISGDIFTEGIWTTQDRKVYEANITGIQSGTFDDNLDKWDQLISVQGFDRILTTVGGTVVPDNVGNLVIA